MNILVITAYHPPYHLGGYEIRCKNIMEELVKRGHEVTVVTTILPDARAQNEDNIYRVLHAARSRNLIKQVMWDSQDLHWINKLIYQKNIDLLYLWHTIVLSRTIFPFIAEKNLPTVYDEGGIGLSHAWTKHGDWINYCDRKRTSRLKEKIRDLVRTLARAYSGGILPIHWRWPEDMFVYFNSQAGLESAKQVGVPVEKASVVYSGLQLDNFPFRKSSPFSNKVVRLIVPGRIVRIKALELAIRVLQPLKKLSSQQQFEMVIVGQATDEVYFEEIKELISQLDLQDDVRVLNVLKYDEMASLYHSAEFCLFPSQQQEGFSRVPLEAMACGSLVISAGNEGSREIIEDGVTGHIRAFEHPDEVALAILNLVKNHHSFFEVIKKARNKTEKSFTIEKAVGQIEHILVNATQTLQ